MRDSLLIFAKYPTPGKVKTRLGKTLGAEKAAFLYRRMVEIVIQRTRPPRAEYGQVLCYDPPDRRKDFERWFPSVSMTAQSGHDLGQRMKTALECSLKQGAKRAILIGTDCLQIDSSLILEAFQKLSEHDLILGPARDGGYYLIGSKKVYPELFQGMPWSTPHVLPQTIGRAKEAGLKIALLHPLEDIDTFDDYERLSERV